MLCQRFWGRDNCPWGKWYLGVCKKSQLEKVVAGFSPVSHPVKVSNSFSDRQGGQDPSPTGPHPYGQQPYLGSGVGVTILFPSQTVSITGQFGVTWRISTPLVHPSSWLGCTTLSQQPPRLVILLFWILQMVALLPLLCMSVARKGFSFNHCWTELTAVKEEGAGFLHLFSPWGQPRWQGRDDLCHCYCPHRKVSWLRAQLC